MPPKLLIAAGNSCPSEQAKHSKLNPCHLQFFSFGADPSLHTAPTSQWSSIFVQPKRLAQETPPLCLGNSETFKQATTDSKDSRISAAIVFSQGCHCDPHPCMLRFQPIIEANKRRQAGLGSIQD